MSRAKIEVIDIADFGSESEDDEWERKHIEKEDDEIRAFFRSIPYHLGKILILGKPS